jgi:hypothetical protein
LIYTYIYGPDDKKAAEDAAELLDHAYRAQFRADKDALPELAAIYLEVKLAGGAAVFSQKYDKRVTFGYDKE